MKRDKIRSVKFNCRGENMLNIKRYARRVKNGILGQTFSVTWREYSDVTDRVVVVECTEGEVVQY